MEILNINKLFTSQKKPGKLSLPAKFLLSSSTVGQGKQCLYSSSAFIRHLKSMNKPVRVESWERRNCKLIKSWRVAEDEETHSPGEAE